MYCSTMITQTRTAVLKIELSLRMCRSYDWFSWLVIQSFHLKSRGLLVTMITKWHRNKFEIWSFLLFTIRNCSHFCICRKAHLLKSKRKRKTKLLYKYFIETHWSSLSEVMSLKIRYNMKCYNLLAFINSLKFSSKCSRQI